MLALQGKPPVLRGLFAGGIYALLVLLMAVFEGAAVSDTLAIRMMFAFAAGLVFQEVTDGAVLMRGPRTWRNPHRWMFGYVMGACWAAIMIIALWDSDAPAQHIVTWGFSGMLFGAIMALWPDREAEDLDALQMHYQTDRPQFARAPILYWFYFAWPFVTWGIVALLADRVTPNEGDPRFVWFIMIFFVSVNAAYASRSLGRSFLFGPTPLGMLILVSAIWLA